MACRVTPGVLVGKARVRLDAKQYEMALEAHRQEASLQVKGALNREGSLYWMYQAERVSIVATGPPSEPVSTGQDFEQPELRADDPDDPD